MSILLILSSVFGAYMFGLFDTHSPEMEASLKTVEATFGLRDDVVGLPRYENDEYRREDPSVTGNWWYITSLWLAQYSVDTNDTPRALKILNWVRDNAVYTGMLGEQINPLNNQVVSPAPLAWSHAEYLSTWLDMIRKDTT